MYSCLTRSNSSGKVIDAGDAVRDELRRHEQMLHREEAARAEQERSERIQVLATCGVLAT